MAVAFQAPAHAQGLGLRDLRHLVDAAVAGGRSRRTRLLQSLHPRQAGRRCVTCHGRIDEMAQVAKAQPLSMGWCLECHRHPERFLRPRDQVTSMTYKPKGDQLAIGRS